MSSPLRRLHARRVGVALALVTLTIAATATAGARVGAGQAPPGPGTLTPPDPYYPDLGNRGYDVRHYDLGITFAPPERSIRGDVKIEATADRLLSRFHLDLSGLEVRRVDVDGTRARFTREADELVVRPTRPIRKNATFTVRVRYDGIPEPNVIAGIDAPNGWLETPDGATTLDEPDGARTWFPANDHPQDKATFTFRLTVPDGLTAVANGTLAERVPRPGNMTTWVWDDSGPMTTYLTQIGIGELALVDAEPVDGVKIRNVFSPETQVAAAAAAQSTPEMMQFLTAQLGSFPFESYGILVVEGALDGLAFEGQTLSVFAPDFFFDADAASAVMAHELAHQWFGDWVSPATWDQTWLNEGFATYYEWLWTDHALGVSLDDLIERARRIVSANAVDVATDDPGIDDMFGIATYERGALTVDALQRTVGPEVFSTIVSTYLERFGGGVATTDDLIEVASEVTGDDMEPFFRAWLGPGPLPERP